MMAKEDSARATKLLHAVIAKSFLEVGLICVVATMAAFTNFSPLLRGAIDTADQAQISGWVLDPLAPQPPMEVQLFIDGVFVSAERANRRRDDLVHAGVAATPHHGFFFSLPSLNLAAGTHAIQVYAVREATGVNKILLPVTRKPWTIEVRR